MKSKIKNVRYIAFVVIILLFSSCRTALKNTLPPLNLSQEKGTEYFEFIGYKNLNNAKLPLLEEYGNHIDGLDLALDRSWSYQGDFSSNSLAGYNSSKRYLAYFDIVNAEYGYNDRYGENVDMFVAGIVLTCCCILPVGIPMMCAWVGNKCELALKYEYVLQVYDTTTKEFVYGKPRSVNLSHVLKGKYLHSKTNRSVFDEYMKESLWNEMDRSVRVAERSVKMLNQ